MTTCKAWAIGASAPALAALLMGLAGAMSAVPARAGVQAPAPSGVQQAPPYRTRIPPSTKLEYRLSRGIIAGSGVIDWRAQGGNYTLRLQGDVPVIGSVIVQTSRGALDGAGLAPTRFTDKRLSHKERVANFQRDAGKVTFSRAPSKDVPIEPGMQDRLSVMIELSAIVNAWSAPPPAGTVLHIPVAGTRDASDWALRFLGIERIDTPSGPLERTLHFVRDASAEHDTRAEFWLDPALSNLPVKARFTDGDDDPLELVLTGHTP